MTETVISKKSKPVKSGNKPISTPGESSYSDNRTGVGSLNNIQLAADSSKKAAGITQLSSMADDYVKRPANASHQKIVQKVGNEGGAADAAVDDALVHSEAAGSSTPAVERVMLRSKLL